MIVSAAKAREAAEVLGVELEGLTPKAIQSAYRTKAKACHPDQHGNAKLQEWAKVSWANECLKVWAAKHPPEQPSDSHALALDGPPCRVCKGEGRVPVNQGMFSKPLTMQCVMCRGQGVIEKQEDDSD